MMDFIRNKLLGLLVGSWLKSIWNWLDGKKTVLGAIQLVLFVIIWVLPQLFPELKQYGELTKQLVQFLVEQGFPLQGVLVEATSLTLLGLYHKMIKLLQGDKD